MPIIVSPRRPPLKTPECMTYAIKGTLLVRDALTSVKNPGAGRPQKIG